jgi:hypothetical protein
VTMVSFEAKNITNLKSIIELVAGKNRLRTTCAFEDLRGSGGSDVLRVQAIGTRPWPCPHIGSGPERAKPSDIPIFRPTEFELAVNLKIEKALVSKCRLSHSRSLAR